MSAIAVLPGRVSRRREKVFGNGRCQPLDRNAKARIMVYARAWSARNRQPGQHHRGPLTRAYMEVLKVLLWDFHNSRDGRCFPSYATIAARAQCNPDTVYEAIKALEAAKVMTWVNRLIRVKFKELDLFGKLALRTRVIRTSNAYAFRDPLPCAQAGQGRDQSPGQCPERAVSGLRASEAPFDLTSKSANPGGTLNQDILNLSGSESYPKTDLEKALAKFQTALSTKESSIMR